MSSNSNHLSDINSILSLFSSFFKSATSAHPKTSLLNSHLTSFTNFLLANKDDLSKGFQFLNNLKASITVPEPLIEPIEQLEQINKDRNEISINDLKINDSQYKFFNELKEYDFLQEVKAYFYDQKLFSYENILFCVSVKYWELILNNIDKNNLNLMENVKEKIFYDSLPQNIQEKILEFLNKIEEIQKINHLGYKKSFEYFLISIKTIDFFTIMVPMIKQIIIKFLINSDWNYLRDKLQDKLNPNSLNQIFALFKNNSSNPQKDTDIINFEENTHNFLQILALGLNANIKVLWSNSNSETNISLKNFYCKNKDEIIGEIHLFIFKNQNKIWYYFNLVKNDEEKIIIEEKNEFKKQSNPFLKSHSIKINDEMFSNNNKNQIFSNETMLGSVQLVKKTLIFIFFIVFLIEKKKFY